MIDDTYFKYLIHSRRYFHRNPEIGFTEYQTTAYICQELQKHGFDITFGRDLYPAGPHPFETLIDEKEDAAAFQKADEQIEDKGLLEKMNGGFTGVVGRLRCGNGEKKIGFRFDIDALPIRESKDPEHFPFKEGFVSENNHMHACAHDGHAAIGLGLAKKIAGKKDELNADIYLMFQPAEELIGGGLVFSKLDFIKDLDCFLAIHLGLYSGRKVYCGLRFFDSQMIEVTFKGNSAHSAGSPELGRNALLAACNSVPAIYGLSQHSGGRIRSNVGKFISNNASNVISDHVTYELDLRAETREVFADISEKAAKIIKGAASMCGVEAKIDVVAESVSAKNSTALSRLVADVARKCGIEEADIIPDQFTNGSEDATFIMREVLKNGGQACYIGIASPTAGGHHNPMFDFEEERMLLGLDIIWNVLKDLS